MNCSTKTNIYLLFMNAALCATWEQECCLLCKYGQCFVWEGIQMGLETNLMESCQPAFG